eukprot:TRINITY_DN24225_c0_g1_i1.p1 TRINITY_DN24225_c0_g1~~TRINITY_DN24225_c0_g1_i1.p1  ORF type:complete len:396 (-),score=68.04 TRINITY_DN24225_c0_g1_i1:156-1343(-)
MLRNFHAECHLDVSEIPYKEIQFKQVEGDFEVLQGKWIIQEVRGIPESPLALTGPQSSLQYAVEMVVPKSNKLFGYLEPLLDKFAVEDLPINLTAIKQKIEYNQKQTILKYKMEQFERTGDFIRARTCRNQLGRALQNELEMNLEVLKDELIKSYGHLGGCMPVQNQFFSDGRADLVIAMQRFGGPNAVAKQLGWKMSYSRRPRGYWMDIQTLRTEMEQFLKNNNLPPKTLPSRGVLLDSNRQDLVRAIENHYGGFIELAITLGWDLSQGAKLRIDPDKFQNLQLRQKMVLSTHEVDAAFNSKYQEHAQLSVEEEEKYVQDIMDKYNKQMQEEERQQLHEFFEKDKNCTSYLSFNYMLQQNQQSEQEEQQQLIEKNKSYSDLDEEGGSMDIIMGV